jgi:hypothetical protein
MEWRIAMTKRAQMQLFFHGSIILLGAILSGLPLAIAIVKDWGAGAIHAWAVTHASLASASIMLIAVGAAARHLVLPDWESRLLLWTLLGSTYALCIGLVVTAISGDRGMEPVGSTLNLALYAMNVAGVLGALGAGALLVRGAYAALREEARSTVELGAARNDRPSLVPH